jgi:hypothetical protein
MPNLAVELSSLLVDSVDEQEESKKTDEERRAEKSEHCRFEYRLQRSRV